MASVLLPAPWMTCKDGTPRKNSSHFDSRSTIRFGVALERVRERMTGIRVRDDAHVIDAAGLRNPAGEP